MTMDLRTIPGVELIRCGVWEISTGRWEVTPADLVAAVAAHQAGALRRPPIRLGHVDERFDGQPALGYVDNLRVVDNGHTLLGDLVGVPALLADLMPAAYADRSVEGVQGFVDASGRTYSFALTGLALLGATAPGISTLRSLADVGALYGVAAATGQRVIRLHTTAPGDAGRRRRVVVRAAGTRRRQRRAVIILAAIDAANPKGTT
jgi:hypothetical protein